MTPSNQYSFLWFSEARSRTILTPHTHDNKEKLLEGPKGRNGGDSRQGRTYLFYAGGRWVEGGVVAVVKEPLRTTTGSLGPLQRVAPDYRLTVAECSL